MSGARCGGGLSAYIAVTVAQALANGRHERLQKIRLLELAQETQRGAPHKLIWVLQVLQAANQGKRENKE